ncbi:hypothetical protein KQI82_12560 [Oscillibacter sp. MSJ-2]|uniref:Uncharacterized protein n=1 Tax=Dysosmobacter acutus TaxID=2841504 RepID=A0ABS6FDV7_9FIRM|nr:hypothetical protein [Dysosmobacter acutus]MBU5627742.1 hypothetical protein [Dysosmobacter acutus]
MNNSRKEMEKNMRHVLSLLDNTAELPHLSDTERYALKQCQEKGYVEGLRVSTMESGRVVVDYAHPRLTIDGLKFLYPYKDWKFVTPTVIAIIELIVIIIQTIQNAGC